MHRVLVLCCLLAAPTALAAGPRINLQVKGRHSQKVHAQLKKKLCREFRCVKPGKKRRAPVDAVVYGAVEADQLELRVYTDESSPSLTEMYSLASRGHLPSSELTALVAAVDGALRQPELD